MAANKVLIVDENSEMRTKIREMLPSGNFQVLEAIDGEETMLMFDLEHPGLRLVIFNFKLPVVSGWEVLKKLQTDATLQKAATIVICDRVEEIQAVVPQPYFEYIEVLEAPCDRKTLQQAMKSAVGKTKRPRPPLPTEPLAAPTSPSEPVIEQVSDLLNLDLGMLAAEEVAAETEIEESLSAEPERKLEEEFAEISARDARQTTEETDFEEASPEIEEIQNISLNASKPSVDSANPPPSPEADTPEENTEVAATPLAPEVAEEGKSVAPETAGYAIAPTPYETLECYHISGDRVTWGISCLAISPDGQYLIGGSESNPIKIWNLATGTIETQWNLFSQGTSCLALTLDGQIVVAGAAQTNLKLWNFYTGELLGPLNDQSCGTTALAIAPDGLTLVSGALRSNVKLWDLENGNLIGPLNDQSFGTTALAIAPDGRTLITGCEPTNIKLWDFATGELLGPLNIESSNVTALILSPDGQLVISGHRDGAIAIADLYTGQVLRHLKAHQQPVNALAITPDGQVIISASDTEIKYWAAVMSPNQY
jgi:CheY-like chemotaxis protein